MSIRYCGLAALLVGAMALPLTAADEPSLDDILKKNIEARGGQAKIDAVKSIRMKGKIVLAGGQLEAPIAVQIKRPNLSYAEVEVQGKKIIEVFDGTSKWSINPMTGSSDPQKSDADESKAAADDADSIEGPLMKYKAKGHTLELLGKEDVEGSPAYKLKLTTKNGNISTIFLDAQNYLEIKLVAKRKQMGQEFEAETYMSNYKAVEGMMMPFAIETKVSGQTMMQMQMEKVELNVPIDDAIFKMPVKEEKKADEKKPEEKK